MSSKTPTPGIYQSIRSKLFGDKNRIQSANDLDKIGLKVVLDWHMAERLDSYARQAKAIREEKTMDGKLLLDKELLDEMSFYGEPADNPVFFKKNSAWQRLYHYYRIGKEAGNLDDETLMADAEELHMLANVARTASMFGKWIYPNTPIVIQAQPPGNKQYSGPPDDESRATY